MPATIRGLQELRAEMLGRIGMMEPSGELGDLVKDVTIFAHSEAVKVTHVDTGALRSSHEINIRGLQGTVSIDPGATNPRSGQRVEEYAPFEHGRGGGHAFYEIATKRARQYAKQLLDKLAKRMAK